MVFMNIAGSSDLPLLQEFDLDVTNTLSSIDYDYESLSEFRLEIEIDIEDTASDRTSDLLIRAKRASDGNVLNAQSNTIQAVATSVTAQTQGDGFLRTSAFSILNPSAGEFAITRIVLEGKKLLTDNNYIVTTCFHNSKRYTPMASYIVAYSTGIVEIANQEFTRIDLSYAGSANAIQTFGKAYLYGR